MGGKPRNKHHQNRGRKPVGKGAKSGVAYDKTAVLSLVNRESGEVRSVVVPDVTGATLRRGDRGAGRHAHLGPAHRCHDALPPDRPRVRDPRMGRPLGRRVRSAARSRQTTPRAISRSSSAASMEPTITSAASTFPATSAGVRLPLHRTWKLDDSARLQEMVNRSEGRRLELASHLPESENENGPAVAGPYSKNRPGPNPSDRSFASGLTDTASRTATEDPSWRAPAGIRTRVTTLAKDAPSHSATGACPSGHGGRPRNKERPRDAHRGQVADS